MGLLATAGGLDVEYKSQRNETPGAQEGQVDAVFSRLVLPLPKALDKGIVLKLTYLLTICAILLHQGMVLKSYRFSYYGLRYMPKPRGS